MDLGLRERTVLVMGGSRGLGAAVAEALRLEGAQVVTTSRKPRGGEMPQMALDTSDATSIEAFLSRWGDRPLDGVFVNTGGPPPGNFGDLEDAAWQDAHAQILLGPIKLLRGLRPLLRPGAAVLFNTSSSIRVPMDFLLLSNVYRAGILALAKSLSVEWAGDGIRVNTIAPGRIATERVAELDQAASRREGRPVVDIQSASERDIPLGRYGKPEEFGAAAVFLMSRQASYLTGISLLVDGGKIRAL